MKILMLLELLSYGEYNQVFITDIFFSKKELVYFSIVFSYSFTFSPFGKRPPT